VAILELHGECMLSQSYARRLLVSLQSGLETGPNTSGFRVVTHITSREDTRALGGELDRCEEMMARSWVLVEGWGEPKYTAFADIRT
jgi:hypothetical protein